MKELKYLQEMVKKIKSLYHAYEDIQTLIEMGYEENDPEIAREAQADMEKIAAGIELDDGEIHADAISYTDEAKKSDVGIEIHSGKNRIVRRIFESLGYKVQKLDRVYFAGLTKKGLRRGEWRYLNEAEVNHLRMGAFD